MGAKESPRFGSGTLWGKEVWEGEWPGPGEAEEGGLGMGPKNDLRAPNVYTVANSCPDRDSDVKLSALTFTVTLPLFSHWGQGTEGACKLKFLPSGRGEYV